jgi:hypothetical protein
MQVVGRARDLERCIEDVGVRPQLLDGPDTKRVGGQQAKARATPRTLLGGDFCDGRRLAASGRADEYLGARVLAIRCSEIGEPRRERITETGW